LAGTDVIHQGGAARFRRAKREEAEQRKSLLDEVRRQCLPEGMRRFARRAGIAQANLNRALKGRTNPSLTILAKLRTVMAEEV